MHYHSYEELTHILKVYKLMAIILKSVTLKIIIHTKYINDRVLFNLPKFWEPVAMNINYWQLYFCVLIKT